MTMKNENENSSAFDELDQNDRISPLDFKEPELHDFDVTSVFEFEALEPEKKSRKLFGKRQARRANVKIREDLYEEDKEAQVQEPLEDFVDTKTNEVEEMKVVEEAVVVADKPQEETETVAEEVEETVVADEPQEEVTEEQEEEEPAVVFVEEENDIPEVSFAQDIEEVELDEAMDEAFEEMDESEDEEAIIEEEESNVKGIYEGKDLDLFEDKKKFFLSQYSIVEEYLREQSNDGYHFVRHEGKKYYFVEGEPMNYYYSIDYFREEPSAEQWKQWEQDGWKLISKEPGKKKKEAGWFVFRNLQNEGEYRLEIDNDEEKFRFFKKYANSCRSTLFLIFICMFCCLITAFLQYQFKGYLWGIGICLFVFLLSFIFFITYYRMLRHAKKRVRLLKARLRVKENNRIQIEKDTYDVSESEAQLESDWNTVTGKIDSGKEKRKRRRKKNAEEGQE